jgi:hypothetical protein
LIPKYEDTHHVVEEGMEEQSNENIVVEDHTPITEESQDETIIDEPVGDGIQFNRHMTNG